MPRATRSTVRTAAAVACLIGWCVAPQEVLPISEDQLRALSGSPKLIAGNSPLDDFAAGAATARVIVNLREPAGTNHTGIFADEEGRRNLRAEVREAQDRAIASLDLSEIDVRHSFSYVCGFSAEVTAAGLRDLIGSADVLSIEQDRILEAHLAQGIPLMSASAVRGIYDGWGVSIAICDTGIDYTHPMLGGGGFPNSKVIGGYDCGDNDTNPMDAQGHGTCCAGIAAGSYGSTGDYIGGVAPNAKLYAVKIAYGSSGSAYTADMIEGWEWCITHQYDNTRYPIRILSTSFGGGRYYATCDSTSPSMTAAAANAVAAGITIFASSGNDGYCNSMGWPACISHVISVGAVYDAAFGTYYPCVNSSSCAVKYSTTGCSTGYYSIDSTAADMVTSYSNTASFLTLLAPSNSAYTTDIVGTGGYSTGSYYSSFGGTSAACPYAAGSAACLQSAAVALTGDYFTSAEIRSLLTDNGDPVTDGKVSITTPRVNLLAAVESITPSSWTFPLKINQQSTDPPLSDFRPDRGLPFYSWIRYGWLP